MKKRRNNIRMIYVNAALKITPLLLIISGGAHFVISTFSGHFEEEKQHQDLIDAVVFEQDDQEIVEEIIEPQEECEKEEVIIEENIIVEEKLSSTLLDSGYDFQYIDFTTLKEINNDTCAWIYIDGTNINLPIVHGEDNDYYLHHDIEGNESKYGTLFIDSRNNSLDEQEENISDFTIIYGHHMANGKMLAPICNYKSQSYYDNHKFGVVYTPDGYAYEAEFFAGTIIDGADDSKLFADITDEERYMEYINNIRAKSTFNSDVEVTYGDKILALVTCSYETNNSRYVLYAVLNKQYTNDYQKVSQASLIYRY